MKKVRRRSRVMNGGKRKMRIWTEGGREERKMRHRKQG